MARFVTSTTGRTRAALGLAVLLVVGLVVPSAQGQDDPGSLEQAKAEREAARSEALGARIQLEVINAEDIEVVEALEAATELVNLKEAEVDRARQALKAAEATVLRADAAAADAEDDIAWLREQIRVYAVEAYVDTRETDLETWLSSEDATDAANRLALLDNIGTGSGDLLDQLRAIEADRVAALAEAEGARDEAAELTDTLAEALVQLELDRDRQQELKAEVDARRATWESELASYEAKEAELTAFIAAEEARIAAEEAAPRRRAAEQAAAAEAAAQAAQAARPAQAPASAPSSNETGGSSSGGSSSSGSSSGSSTPAPSAPAPSTPPPSSGDTNSSGWTWPAGGAVGSGFGMRLHPILGYYRMHNGLDIGGSQGSPIWAASSGTVLSAGWQGGFGNAVIISHGNGVSSLYAHMSSISVSSGQTVSAGQTIGAVGSTGLSTGPHLHFEVHRGGTPVDPRPFLP